MKPFQKPIIVMTSLAILKKGTNIIFISFEYLNTFDVYNNVIDDIIMKEIIFM